MPYTTLIVETADHICTIMINRPDKLNALNQAVMQELSAAVEEVYKNKNIKAAIITGSGHKAFVAGADISEFEGLSAEQGKALSEKGQELFFKIENCPKPVVAAVNGFALGGGCELAMACHFRVVANHAKFGQPEVNLGLLPGYGGTQRLTQLIGKGRAIEMLLTGNMIDAITAFNYGLANHVVLPEELLPRAKSLLAVINTKAPLAIAGCIQAANDAWQPGRRGYETEAGTFGKLIVTEDAREGISAFMEKRKPGFKGE